MTEADGQLPRGFDKGAAGGHVSDTLVILDGNTMLHKCYHAAPKRLSPDGREVGAVLAVCGQLTWLLRKMRSRHLVMAFDPGGRLFRHDLAPTYKANRVESPADLRSQLVWVREAVASLGIVTVSVPGFEADDCIATLATLGREEGMSCWMVGNDKDLFQLITDTTPFVKLFILHTRSIIDEAAVEAKIGVPPVKAVDYFALTGDASDNIPGVRTVGPVAAAALLQRFDSLEGIYSNLHAITELDVRGAGRLPLRLLDGREDAESARQLVRLRRDVPLGLGPLRTAAAWLGPTPEADALFEGLGDSQALTIARSVS